MITHVLKDGTRKEDISGHRVSPEDCPAVYKTLEMIVRRASDNKANSEKPGRVA